MFTIKGVHFNIDPIQFAGGFVFTMSAKNRADNTKKKETGKIASSKTRPTSKDKKKKNHLLKLCKEMNNYEIDANDREIIKRFKTSISSSIEDDISRTSLDLLLKKPKEVEINGFSENIQPYIKHYLFMLSRSIKKK